MTLRMDRVRFLELLAAGFPTGVALLVLLVALYLHSFDPVNYFRLVAEDFYGEYATALSFLLAGSFFAVLACRRVSGQKRPIWALMAVALAAVGMEELSWGQRIFGFSTPQFLESINSQAELTFHNTRGIKEPLAYWTMAIFSWSAASLLLPILWPRLHQWFDRYGIPMVPAGVVPVFVMAVVVQETRPVIKAQEVAELLLGLGFAFLALRRFSEDLGGRWQSPSIAVRNAVVLLSVLAILTTALVVTHGGNLKAWLHVAAMEFYPKRGMYDQAEAVFAYLYRHPDLLRAETPLQRGMVLQQAGRDAEAEAILQQALVRESSRRPRSKGRGAQYRRMAQIRLMLGAEEEVAADLEEALRLDRQALALATTGDDKARLLWSIAQTQLVRGEKDGARRTAQQAVDTAGTVAMRHRIRKWLLDVRADGSSVQDSPGKVAGSADGDAA